jgi:hypothetical protein
MTILRVAVLSGACLLGSQAEAADPVVSGIYRIEAGQPPSAASAIAADPEVGPGHYTEYFEPVLPLAAQVRYAVVARAPVLDGYDEPGYRLAFLADKAYEYDGYRNRVNVAYASSEDGVFHAIYSSGLQFQWEDASFTIRRPDETRSIGSEFIEPTREPRPEEIGVCTLGGPCAADAFGTLINHYERTHYADRFVLETARDYRDILHLEKTVPFYRQADRATPQGAIEAGTFVAILAQGVEWNEIEQVAMDGRVTHGWVNRDDLVEVRWVEQLAGTAALRFRLAYPVPKEDSDYYDPDAVANPIAIEVLDRATGQRLQVLRDFYSESRYRPSDEETLSVLDANFDGQPDISIPAFDGGAGPNSSDNFFLFDAASNRFVFNEELSSLTQTVVDAEHQTITSASRGSCCDHSASTWRFIDGKLTEVASWHEFLSWDENDGDWIGTTTCNLVEGEMRCETTREPYVERP